jgi:hypothetical protein
MGSVNEAINRSKRKDEKAGCRERNDFGKTRQKGK